MELKNRYLSLDVFRGMDVVLMIIVNNPGDHSTTFSPLLHAKWNGCTLTDLVFPTFLFVVGTSLSFSLAAYQSAGNQAVMRKVLKRTAIIFLLGYLMYWFPFVKMGATGEWVFKPIGETRILGVLQRIALGYGLATLIIHYWKLKGAIIFSSVALLGYWLILTAFGDLTLTGNAVLTFDRWLMGESHLYRGEGIAFDPEGILSTLPAIVNVLAGYCAGWYLRKNGLNNGMIVKLLMSGVTLVLLGLTWDMVLPMNKKIWTSSFVLYATGMDVMFLAILVYVIDVRNLRIGTYFFEVLGRNTLFVYLLSELLAITLDTIKRNEESLHDWIFTIIFKPLVGDYAGSLFFALSFMLVCWCVGYWMDRKKIYVKI